MVNRQNLSGKPEPKDPANCRLGKFVDMLIHFILRAIQHLARQASSPQSQRPIVLTAGTGPHPSRVRQMCPVCGHRGKTGELRETHHTAVFRSRDRCGDLFTGKCSHVQHSRCARERTRRQPTDRSLSGSVSKL